MTVEAKVAIAADNSQLLRVLEESKTAMTAFFETITEESSGVSAALEGIQEKFTNAFQFTGVALATEAIEKIGETIERLGTKALEIKTVSSVIGVTTDQFQAMQEAAEEAGVGSDSLTHAGERLVSMLTEARNGSSAAIDKLLALGVGIEQVNDPTFKLNDLLQVLHERLENSATSQDMMNELILVLGNRAALAAAAIKEYDGSAQSVQATLDRINGLTEQQIDRLGKAKTGWSELGQTISNTFTKLALGDRAPDLSGMNALTMGNAGSAQQAQQAVNQTGNPFAQLEEQAGQAAEQVAESMKKGAEQAEAAQHQLSTEMLQQELTNIKAGVVAFQDGSARKVSALQEEYRVAQQLYGSDQVDKVQAIYQQLIAAQKAYYDAQIRASKEAETAEDERVSRALRGIQSQIDASGRYLEQMTKDQKTLDELSDQSASLLEKVNKERIAGEQHYRQISQKVADDWYQKWAGVSGAIESSFSGAISGMLQGTMTFVGALQSIFTSVVDSLIQMFVKMGIQWAEGLIYQEVAQKATAISSITANSGIAATAAMASVAAIPFYGWAMAPEVGATTFAEGLSYLASASAAGGFDVPTGENPVTQLHAREMVLPQSLADPIRDMASGGKRGGPGSAIPFKKMGDHMVIHMGNLKDALRSLGYQFKLT